MKKVVLAVCITAILSFRTVSMGADYFPLAVGNVWNYTAATKSNKIWVPLPDSGGKYEIISTVSDNDIEYFVLTLVVNFSQSVKFMDTMYVRNAGNDVMATYALGNDKSEFKIAQHLYSDGDEWSPGNDNVIVSSLDQETVVPAGSFADCFEVRTSADSISVFAPNVGPIDITGIYGGSFHLRLQLSTYNLQTPTPVARPGIINANLYAHRIDYNKHMQTISFDLGNNSNAKLDIFRADGKLINAYELGGTGTIPVDRTGLGSGNVFVRLRVGDKQYTGKLSIAK